MKNRNLNLLTEQEEGYGFITEWNTNAGCSGYVSLELQNKEILKEFVDKSVESNAVFMNCILQKCDTQNRNGRFYPREILEREDKKYQELIREGRALGASDHPDCTFVSLKKDEVSHRVVKTWWEGTVLMGVLEIFTTEGFTKNGVISCQGDFIAFLLSKGTKLGISSRGVGSLKNIGGKNTVQSDFDLICYDLVSSPSTTGAFLYPEKEVSINENIGVSHKKDDDLSNKLKNFLRKN